ncbi:MAG: purine-nucleoside phosphorylase [Spirochaetales bacterium]|nr:purine-nucleoside phosphorylase [Spirochaetales bacterium]
MVEGYTYEFYRKAASFVRERILRTPEIAVVLGTGCGPFAERITDAVSIPYSEIPGFPISTNPDHAGFLVAGYVGDRYIICMNGRFHFYEGYSMEELNIPVHVLFLLGVKKLVLTNASGSCNPDFRPGDAMIISDHIKLYGGSPMRGPNVPELGPRFFDVHDLYTSRLREIARDCARRASLKVHEGVYMFFPGPQFETACEIRAARILGADAVGMSTVTEALTAAHCGMELLGIALITNMATGMEDGKVDGSEVNDVAASVAPAFSSFLENVVKSI